MIDLLLVEDSPDSRLLITSCVPKGSVNITVCESVTDAREKLANRRFEFYIVDLSLGDGTGFEVLDLIRSKGSADLLAPVLIISADAQIGSRISAFQLGADDYILKPFSPLELKAKIESKVKKLEVARRDSGILDLGFMQLNPTAQVVTVHETDGTTKRIDLTPREFRLLYQLSKRPDQILTREQLLNAVWGDVNVSDRTVDTHISTLRQKLGKLKNLISSVKGEGYRFKKT